MSQNRYSFCPKCKEQYKNRMQKMLDSSDKKLSKEDKEKIQEELEDLNGLEKTLHENYECFLQDQHYHHTYGAKCSKCGFSFNKVIKERIQNV